MQKLKYSDGNMVRLGDKVQLWKDCYGMVVCSIDTDEYAPAYPKAEWAYLETGVLIRTDKGELIHFVEADEDLKLLQ